jgi:molybdopterin-guanine dinucleotide biosynthesis protein A
MRVTGIVLAGGRSSRMGQDKAALVLDGRTLLQRACDALTEVADEIVVVGSPGRALPEIVTPVPVRRVDDEIEGEGPLFGIAAGLEAARSEVAMVVGCDMPYLVPALLRLLAARALEGARLVVPLHEGRPESLCSAWRTDALAVIRAHIEAGDRAVMSVSEDLEAVRLAPEEYREADPDARSFINVNTPAELEAEIEARKPAR